MTNKWYQNFTMHAKLTNIVSNLFNEIRMKLLGWDEALFHDISMEDDTFVYHSFMKRSPVMKGIMTQTWLKLELYELYYSM